MTLKQIMGLVICLSPFIALSFNKASNRTLMNIFMGVVIALGIIVWLGLSVYLLFSG